MALRSYPDLYRDIEDHAKAVRGMTFIPKDESPSMRLLAKLLIAVPGMSGEVFMERFTSHLGGKVYWSRKLSRSFDPLTESSKHLRQQRGKARTLCHEMVHEEDESKYGIWFKISYGLWRLIGLPVFVMLPITVFQLIHRLVAHFTGAQAPEFGWWNLWAWLALAVIALPPWPEYFRMIWELRGYSVSMWFDWRTRSRNIFADDYLDWYIGTFTGPNYYYMWWFSGDIRRRLQAQREKIRKGTLAAEIATVAELEPIFKRYFGEAPRP